MPYYRQDNPTPLPPRVHAALKFLDHTYFISHQDDSAIVPRPLTPLETSVETAALRVLQSYFLGEMDFAEAPQPERKRGDDGESPPVPEPQHT